MARHLIENHASKRGNLEKSRASRKLLPLVPLKNSRALVKCATWNNTRLVCPRKNHAPRAPSKVMFVRSQNSRASSALPHFSHEHEKNTRPRKTRAFEKPHALTRPPEIRASRTLEKIMHPRNRWFQILWKPLWSRDNGCLWGGTEFNGTLIISY